MGKTSVNTTHNNSNCSGNIITKAIRTFLNCHPSRSSSELSLILYILTESLDVLICTDNNGLGISSESISTSYRLQDITDVHIMARIQEASEYS